jgi:excinuclease ABC subunit B
MAESLTDYMHEIGIRVRYMHQRRRYAGPYGDHPDLRLGEFDVLVGINLLREGLGPAEVSLVAVLDADKGRLFAFGNLADSDHCRAARNAQGRVILYADGMTDSMRHAH